MNLNEYSKLFSTWYNLVFDLNTLFGSGALHGKMLLVTNLAGSRIIENKRGVVFSYF